MKLLDALRTFVRHVEAGVEVSKLVTHGGLVGAIREEVVRNYLRPFLPSCYGVGTGKVFDAEGNESKQIDIVLYDALFSLALDVGEGIKLFPCESVYGTIEVKSQLTSEALRGSLDNIASLKRLKRAPTSHHQILPHVAAHYADAVPTTADRGPLNSYFGCVFGFKGASHETLLKIVTDRLQDNTTVKSVLPDAIFVADPGYVIIPGNRLRDEIVHPNTPDEINCYTSIPLVGQPPEYTPGETPNDTLPRMLLMLITRLQAMRLKTVEFSRVSEKSIFDVMGRYFGYGPCPHHND